jgi:hypothetical protein
MAWTPFLPATFLRRQASLLSRCRFRNALINILEILQNVLRHFTHYTSIEKSGAHTSFRVLKAFHEKPEKPEFPYRAHLINLNLKRGRFKVYLKI